jgi:adenylyltransferase/sulfurtransferase
MLQATEALKLILGIGNPLVGRLLLFDALDMTMHEVRLRRDPHCPVCGEKAAPIELRDYEDVCQLAGGFPRSGLAEAL